MEGDSSSNSSEENEYDINLNATSYNNKRDLISIKESPQCKTDKNQTFNNV